LNRPSLEPSAARSNRLAAGSLIALILLCPSWELWLAPLRPGGSWLVLKALPLLAPLFGIIHGRRHTHQWASLLSLLYIAEGSIRAMTDQGTSATLAVIELALATVFFAASVGYARLTRPTSLPAPRAAD
jgi:uncharacterized membrane protein